MLFVLAALSCGRLSPKVIPDVAFREHGKVSVRAVIHHQQVAAFVEYTGITEVFSLTFGKGSAQGVRFNRILRLRHKLFRRSSCFSLARLGELVVAPAFFRPSGSQHTGVELRDVDALLIAVSAVVAVHRSVNQSLPVAGAIAEVTVVDDLAGLGDTSESRCHAETVAVGSENKTIDIRITAGRGFIPVFVRHDARGLRGFQVNFAAVEAIVKLLQNTGRPAEVFINGCLLPCQRALLDIAEFLEAAVADVNGLTLHQQEVIRARSPSLVANSTGEDGLADITAACLLFGCTLAGVVGLNITVVRVVVLHELLVEVCHELRDEVLDRRTGCVVRDDEADLVATGLCTVLQCKSDVLVIDTDEDHLSVVIERIGSAGRLDIHAGYIGENKFAVRVTCILRHHGHIDVAANCRNHIDELDDLGIGLHVRAECLHFPKRHQVVERIVVAEVRGRLETLTADEVLRCRTNDSTVDRLLLVRGPLTRRILEEVALLRTVLRFVCGLRTDDAVAESHVGVREDSLANTGASARAVCPRDGILRSEGLTRVEIKENLGGNCCVIVSGSDFQEPCQFSAATVFDVLYLLLDSRELRIQGGDLRRILFLNTLRLGVLILALLRCCQRFIELCLFLLQFLLLCGKVLIDRVILTQLSAKVGLLGKTLELLDAGLQFFCGRVLVLILPVVHFVENRANTGPAGEDIADGTRDLSVIGEQFLLQLGDLVLGKATLQVDHCLRHRGDHVLRLAADGREVDGRAVLTVSVGLDCREQRRACELPNHVGVLRLNDSVEEFSCRLVLLRSFRGGNELILYGGVDQQTDAALIFNVVNSDIVNGTHVFLEEETDLPAVRVLQRCHAARVKDRLNGVLDFTGSLFGLSGLIQLLLEVSDFAVQRVTDNLNDVVQFGS